VKSLLQAAIIFIMISTMVGCSVFRSHTQMMNVTCSQAEAKLYINGREDKNPFEGRVPRNRGVIIECEKEGYDGGTRRAILTLLEVSSFIFRMWVYFSREPTHCRTQTSRCRWFLCLLQYPHRNRTNEKD
jgi:hypothetical protein